MLLPSLRALSSSPRTSYLVQELLKHCQVHLSDDSVDVNPRELSPVQLSVSFVSEHCGGFHAMGVQDWIGGDGLKATLVRILSTVCFIMCVSVMGLVENYEAKGKGGILCVFSFINTLKKRYDTICPPLHPSENSTLNAAPKLKQAKRKLILVEPDLVVKFILNPIQNLKPRSGRVWKKFGLKRNLDKRLRCSNKLCILRGSNRSRELVIKYT